MEGLLDSDIAISCNNEENSTDTGEIVVDSGQERAHNDAHEEEDCFPDSAHGYFGYDEHAENLATLHEDEQRKLSAFENEKRNLRKEELRLFISKIQDIYRLVDDIGIDDAIKESLEYAKSYTQDKQEIVDIMELEYECASYAHEVYFGKYMFPIEWAVGQKNTNVLLKTGKQY